MKENKTELEIAQNKLREALKALQEATGIQMLD